MINQGLESFKRSWLHHTGLQFATLTVLVATYTVVITFSSLGSNLNSILSMWGESVQMTVYLSDEASEENINKLKDELTSIEGVKDIRYVSKKDAAEKFKMDMSGFMPEVVNDQDFATPFPSSFVLNFKEKMRQKLDSENLGKIAKHISSLEGAEDISYGQEWLKNYASFIGGINQMAFTLIIILLFGGVFVIGNAIKTSIFMRKEEIEILELFGATSKFIRTPYVCEGALMGLLASSISLIFTFFLFKYFQESSAIQAVFLSVKTQFKFLSPVTMALFLFSGTTFGALSAFLFVRRLNHGWLAAQRTDI